MIQNVEVHEDEHGPYWTGTMDGCKVGNYYDTDDSGKRIQADGYGTVLGKWFRFEGGIPVRALTDAEAAKVIWDSNPC